MAELRVNTEDMAQVAPALRAGQRVLLSGVCYTSRDAAHKRITQMLDRGEAPPYDLNGAAIYYAGPTPCAGGPSHWLLRAHHQRPHGPLYPPAFWIWASSA